MIAATALVSGASRTQNAIANGDTRTLSIFHTHSKESATITFKRNGSYDRAGLQQLNHILRDWRTHGQTEMDPRLFDVVWEVHREAGSRGAIHIVSAYRAPETNAMLHRRSKGVAKHSQHTMGKAMDFSLPDVPMDKVRAVGMRLQRGGVGYYPSSNPFVHLDVGSVRSWPRMTPDQLARLFPDGKTVHLPTTGKPLAGYDLARAEIEARGGVSAYADAGDAANPVKSFFAALLGGADEAEDGEAQSAGTLVAARQAGDGVKGGGKGGAPAQATALAALRPTQTPVTASLGATIPLPIRRPDFDESRPAQVALMPVPPKRPGDTAEAAASLVSAPLPPARPVAVASLAPLGAADATPVAAGDVPGRSGPTTLAYAPFDRPLPPAHPAPGRAAPAIAARIAMVHANSPVYASDNALRPLFAASVTGSLRSSPARVPAARGHAESAAMPDMPRTPEPALAQRGFVKSATRFVSDRFSSGTGGSSSGLGFQ